MGCFESFLARGEGYSTLITISCRIVVRVHTGKEDFENSIFPAIHKCSFKNSQETA